MLRLPQATTLVKSAPALMPTARNSAPSVSRIARRLHSCDDACVPNDAENAGTGARVLRNPVAGNTFSSFKEYREIARTYGPIHASRGSHPSR
ncbi:Dpi8p [Lachancea thermotolerans CBS 6340]|uniref:KLTH0F05764p n=1 Tax=Lachancea thermotolerans (strain ATCC 56472 / CBS 6340 / NRRL Y-8284) TaxID=559295 RepID=C5DKL8_LACTC|nr:KLTH0F05764p [Lachancea thermotolerans CBS 6340]CAR24019.1 KLTH0F05764p [Lachancea thermotolerans CBS 6340]